MSNTIQNVRIFEIAKLIPKEDIRHGIILVKEKQDVIDLLLLFEENGFYVNKRDTMISWLGKGSVRIMQIDSGIWKYMQISDAIFPNDLDIDTKQRILSRCRSTLCNTVNFFMY